MQRTDYSLSPSGFFLRIYEFTYPLHPVSLLHPVYLTPPTIMFCNREIDVSVSVVSWTPATLRWSSLLYFTRTTPSPTLADSISQPSAPPGAPLADIPGMPSVNWLFKPLLENHIRSSQVEAQYRSTADGGLQVHSASALPGLGLSCSVAHREGSPRGGQMPRTPSQLGGHQHSLVPSGMACCCVPLQGPLSLSQKICAWGLGRVSMTAAELSGCRYRWSWALAVCVCIGGERLESFHFKLKFIRHPELSAF